MNSDNLYNRYKPFAVVTITALIVLVSLLGSAQSAFAQAPNCMQDNWTAAGNNQGLQCTAKEVFIDEDPVTNAKLINVTVVDGCDFPGDTATVDIIASIHFNSDRLDVGVYSALDGGDALNGQCAVDILDPNSPTNLVDGPGSTTVVGTTGSFDVKPAQPPTQDACGDAMFTVGGGGNLDAFSFQTLTLTCVDADSNGQLDFSTCFSWRVDGSDDFCDGTQSDIYPGTPSKCFCETSNIDVPVPSQIIVDKVTVPANDPTSFAFALTGGPNATNETFNLTDQATPHASAGLDSGTYSVVETANPDYVTTAICDDGSPPGAISLQPGETVTCTFTNTLKDTTLSLVKTCPVGTVNPAAVPYTLQVTNSGSIIARDLTLDDVLGILPAGVTYTGWSQTSSTPPSTCVNGTILPGGTPNGSDTVVTCSLDELAVGATWEMVLTFSFTGGAATAIDNAAFAGAANYAAGPVDSVCNFVVPVTIGYFLAEGDDGTVSFTWQTATETDNLGFNLLAATDAGLVQLNDELIPSAAIDSAEPTDYSFTAQTGATVFYLEDVSTQGATDRHGPFELGVASGVYIEDDPIAGGQSIVEIFLPFLTLR